MTATILAAVALAGPLSSAAKPEFQTEKDYSQALLRAANEKKPMAVLIGKGDPFAKLMADAALPADAKKLLAEKYVCVTVDVDTQAGKTLAGQFQLTDGLVISSTGGTHQALRQAGTVTATDLAKHATTYANAPTVPATTVTAGAPVVSTAAPYTVYPAGYTPVYGGCSGGSCPGTVYPAGRYVYPAGYSSCPNGRCPNAGPTIIR
jgi:hypothetical protein